MVPADKKQISFLHPPPPFPANQSGMLYLTKSAFADILDKSKS